MTSRPPIGFVILSHRAPHQLLRLTRTLGRLYDNPPIVCHHDFGQVPLDRSCFPVHVRFVDEWVATGWGKWSVVDAFLRSLSTLYSTANPEWFVLLSGADYPIRPASDVIADLRASGVDAFIDVHQIDPAPAASKLTGAVSPMLHHLDRDESLRTKWGFYRARQFWVPILRRDPHLRLGRFTVRLPWTQSGMFSDDFTLWWGEHWFTGNQHTAEVLLHPTSQHLAFQRYLRWRAFPEEAYYHTVLCNTPDLTINRHNKRYTEWNGGGAHPMTLGMEQLPILLQSGMHFARKFDINSPVLDAIDRILTSSDNKNFLPHIVQ